MKKRTPKKLSKALLKARQMPPLRHKLSDPFDIQESEVVAWLINQPEILNSLFQHFKDQGCIVYDPDTLLWQGVDHQP